MTVYDPVLAGKQKVWLNNAGRKIQEQARVMPETVSPGKITAQQERVMPPLKCHHRDTQEVLGSSGPV
jgi:hypothetical protein